MSTAILQKHWMELRRLWGWSAAFAVFPAVFFAFLVQAHHGYPEDGFIFFFTLIVLNALPPRLAGTGMGTSRGIRPQHGGDPSLLFTLSLPVRRRTLFFYRTACALFIIETAAALGLVVGAGVYIHLGISLRIFAHALWVLLIMVPVYFFDSLLTTRFGEADTMQIHIGCLAVLFFALLLVGVTPHKVTAALHAIAPTTFALVSIFCAAALAILTVWRLERQDY